MKKLLFFVLIIFLGTVYCYAQRKNSVPQIVSEAFVAKVDTVDGQLIRYRETLICPEASDSAALVIFLHSAGGRGSDNFSHIGMPAIKDIYEYLEQHKIHAYFIAPQCPETESWSGVAPDGKKSFRGRSHKHVSNPRNDKQAVEDKTPYIEHLMPFLKKYVEEHPVSKSKIYILGASMGAAGVWMLISQNPSFFAAAMPASGAFGGSDLTSQKCTPVVCTVGTEENSYDKNKRVIQKLKGAGADATFIPLNGMGHVDACNRAFTSANLDLLFSKHR